MGNPRTLRAAAMGCLVAGLSMTAGGEARACGSGAWCEPPVRLFRFPESPVPGNLIHFKVLVEEPGELTLRTRDGTIIPAGIRTIGDDEVFAPLADVAAGLDLELEYTLKCPSSAPVSDKGVFAFSTFDHMAINVEIPALEVYEQGIRYPGLRNNEAVFSRLH